MKSNLTQFLAVSEELRRNLKLASAVEEIRRWHRPYERRYASDRVVESLQGALPSSAEARKFVYSASIVTLYGALEQYVERLIQDCVEVYVACHLSYDTISHDVIRNHALLSNEVLAAQLADRYHGSITETELATGLYRAYQRNAPVKLNAEVFSRHTANFRWPLIRASFLRAGLDVAAVEMDPGLSAAMSEHFPDEADALAIVDDLAERRNSIAHGSATDLLSLELQLAYVSMLEAFAIALLEKATTAVVRASIHESTVALGRPDKHFQGHIAGYFSSAAEVAVGDVMGVVSGASGHMMEVVEIQIAGVSVGRAPVGAEVGIKLSGDFSGRSRLFVLPSGARGGI